MGSISTFCYETRHKILLFTLSYSYQLFINDIYDFFDCIINSTRRLFTNNFKIEGRVIRFSVIFLAMKMDSYNITEIIHNAQLRYRLLLSLWYHFAFYLSYTLLQLLVLMSILTDSGMKGGIFLISLVSIPYLRSTSHKSFLVLYVEKTLNFSPYTP